jgi:hypothetical protein
MVMEQINTKKQAPEHYIRIPLGVFPVQVISVRGLFPRYLYVLVHITLSGPSALFA